MTKYIRICPKCKSAEVTHRGMISGEAHSNSFVCLSCGFQGPMFPEVSQKIAKKLPKREIKFNNSYMPVFSDKAKLTKKENKTMTLRRKILITITAVLGILLLILLLTK